MKASLILLGVALATAQQFNQRREFDTAVRLASPGFFQQGGSFTGRSTFESRNSNQQRQSFSTSNNNNNNNNFQSQSNNFQSTSLTGDRNSFSSQSSQNNNRFQSGSGSFQRNQQNQQTSFDSRNRNQFQDRQPQQNTFASRSFQQNRDNQNRDNQNRFQGSFEQQRSQTQFQTSNDRDNARNRFTRVENVQLTPSTRFQSSSRQQSSVQQSSGQQSSGQQPSGLNFQANRNQQSSGNQFQQSNFNQRNFENNFRSNNENNNNNNNNNNNRFSSGRQSQSSAQVRASSSFNDFEEFNGVFEPLNLPSGASVLLGSISTSFSCVERPYGYYADQDNSCRVFHICNPYLFSDGEIQTYQYSFMCGEGTIFDQDEMTCVSEYEATPCQEASNFYFRNEQFGRPEEKTF